MGESFAKSDGQLAAQIGEPSANCVVLRARKRTVESQATGRVRWAGDDVIKRSLDFYSRILGGKVVVDGENGAPGIIQPEST